MCTRAHPSFSILCIDGCLRLKRFLTVVGQACPMQSVTRHNSPEIWIDQIFSAQAARKGGVVRRSLAWVDREVGRDRFMQEVRHRGFHLIETADQFVVVCHNGPIRILF